MGIGFLDKLGHRLARFLSEERSHLGTIVAPERLASIRRTLRPGDVLLVEGTSRFSTAIKYLTQSTWSHAAICVSDPMSADDPDPPCLIEADVNQGVIRLGLGRYDGFNLRICRPVGLSNHARRLLTIFLEQRLGDAYDLKNVVDLARWLLPTPPVPTRWRRRLIALGSGEPSRAICSTLVAEAFQSIRYPILPTIETGPSDRNDCMLPPCYDEILHIRHHSLFAPRDFDLSPYFQVIKPRLSDTFDPTNLRWSTNKEPDHDRSDQSHATTMEGVPAGRS